METVLLVYVTHDFNHNFNLPQQLVLKEVHETELFKHINKFLSTVGYEDSLTYAAAKACCQGAEILSGSPSKEFCCRETCVKCIKGMSPCRFFKFLIIVKSFGVRSTVNFLFPIKVLMTLKARW